MKRMMTGVLALVLLLGMCGACAEGQVLLSQGSKGAAVAVFQRELIDLGYLQGEADGIYGTGTAMALAEYAASRHLTNGTSVDVDTLFQLMRDTGNRELDLASRGTGVYAVQQLMYTTGFLDEAPDGVFGQNTKSAVREYMLYAAGAAVPFFEDLQTQRRMARTETPSPLADADDEPVITAQTIVTDGSVTEDWLAFMLSDRAVYGPTVAQGDSGKHVLRAQKRLKALGYIAAGADGTFGENSVRAIKYFQKRNNLPETGEVDEATQRALYSMGAVRSDQYVAPYMACVSTTQNRVKIMGWTGDGYRQEVKEFVCTTGKKSTPTCKGTFQAIGPIAEWYYMPASKVWVRYAFQIEGNYFFHSVLYHSKGAAHPTSASVNNLGHNASHGCVRLAVEDVKWIYEHCTAGMTVVIE